VEKEAVEEEKKVTIAVEGGDDKTE